MEATVISYSNCQPLSLSDPAYDEIVKGIRETWPKACITMIDKIDIPHSRVAYEEWRKTLKVMSYEKEYIAYHGTKAENVESICKNGFLPESGRVMAYGYGIYFAKNFSLSYSYTNTERDELEMSYIFVCKLLPGYIAPGMANQLPPDGFHSRADFPDSPNIFAIPKPSMMIPEYLVRFHKKSETSYSEPFLAGNLTEKQLKAQLAATVKQIEAREKKRASKKPRGSS